MSKTQNLGKKVKTCRWRENNNTSGIVTECGENFKEPSKYCPECDKDTLTTFNRLDFKFCPFCGKPICQFQ